MPVKINNKALQKLLSDFQRKLNGKQNEIERQLLIQYSKSLEQIKIEMGKLYERYGSQIADRSYTNYGRLKNLREEITNNIKQILRTQHGFDFELTQNVIKDFYSLSYNNIPNILESMTGDRITFAILSEDAIKAAIRNDYSKIKWTKSTVENINDLNAVVKTEVTQGIIQGRSYGQVATKLNEQLNIGATKALRIVRTETHRAQNQGFLDGTGATNDAAKLLGFEIERVWQHNSNRDPRQVHIKMNGQVADAKGMFTFPSGENAGKKTPGPGLSGIAGEDISCGCTQLIRIKNL